MIALYVHELVHTGVVRNTLTLAEALVGAGHRVVVVTALPGGKVPAGVEHFSLLRGPMRVRKLEHPAAVPALHRYLRRQLPAVAISMGNHGHAVMWAATLVLSRVRTVYRISNDLTRTMAGAPRSGLLKRWMRSRFTRLLADRAERLVLVSPSLLDDPAFAAAHAGGRATVIANGVDVATARRLATEPPPHPWLNGEQPVVLAIGRLSPQKNFHKLLEAIVRLERQQVRLIILGESRDSARSELSQFAERLGIGGQTLLPGTADNVFAWLAHADVFVLPSWWEGSANVLLEAMATGTPVVASRTAGNAAEIVGDRYGLLVDPADPASIACSIARQLDPATRIVPGHRATDYDLRDTLSAWRDLIDDVLAGSAAKAGNRPRELAPNDGVAA